MVNNPVSCAEARNTKDDMMSIDVSITDNVFFICGLLSFFAFTNKNDNAEKISPVVVTNIDIDFCAE